MPGLRQRSPKLEHVSHPVPGEEGGAGEELLDLGLVQPQSAVHLRFSQHGDMRRASRRPSHTWRSSHTCPAYLLPQGFLAGESQREVDPVQGHPVDLSLPSRPVPPHGRVAEGADVLVVAEPGRRREYTFQKLVWNSAHCFFFFFGSVTSIFSGLCGEPLLERFIEKPQKGSGPPEEGGSSAPCTLCRVGGYIFGEFYVFF